MDDIDTGPGRRPRQPHGAPPEIRRRMPGLLDMSDTFRHAVPDAAEGHHLDLARRHQRRHDTEDISPHAGRGGRESASVDAYCELSHVMQNSKCKMQTLKRRASAICILHLA